MMTAGEAQNVLQSDPVAQGLLQAAIPARLAYAWRDGTPRVVPMWFHWTGQEFLMGAPPNAPKMKVLADHPDVAFTIDNNEWPYRVLSVRGTASVREVEGRFPEYEAMARRYLGEAAGQEFLNLQTQTFPRWTRISIRPEHVRILDFETRFPSGWAAAIGKSGSRSYAELHVQHSIAATSPRWAVDMSPCPKPTVTERDRSA